MANRAISICAFPFRLDPEKTTVEGNSGVQYRSKQFPKEPPSSNKWVMSGYQAEIANEPAKRDSKMAFFTTSSGPKERHREDKGTPLYLAMVGEKAVIDEDGLSHPVGSVGDHEAIGNTLHTLIGTIT